MDRDSIQSQHKVQKTWHTLKKVMKSTTKTWHKNRMHFYCNTYMIRKRLSSKWMNWMIND